MDTCQLDVLHNCRYICVGTVADRVGLALQRVIQETVDQNRTIRCHANRCLHIFCNTLLVINHFHTTAAENIRRTYHDRITDACCDRGCFLNGGSHTGFRHRDFQLIHHRTELVTVFCQINDCRRSTQDLYAVLFQIRCQVERCLAAKLRDHTHRLFLVIDAQYIFQGQRLKIQLIGGIIVGRYGLRIAVDNDGLKAQLFQRHCCVYTAVVKLDTLADTVRSAAQDHDLLTVGCFRDILVQVVAGVVIAALFGTGYVHLVPVLYHIQSRTAVADRILRGIQDLCQVQIGEAVFLRLRQCRIPIGICACGHLARIFRDQRFFLIYQFLHLLDEILLYLGDLVDLIHGSALADRFVHLEVTLAVGSDQLLQQFLLGQFVKALHVSQTVTPFLQRTHRLLEGFFIVLADAHNLADRTHLCAQLVFDALELFKCPACKLHYHIVAARNVFIQCAVLAAGDLGQGQSGSQHSGYQCDRETGRLGRQRGRTGGTRVDLDHDDTIGLGIVCKLHVGTADHLDLIYDPVCLLLQTLLQVFRNGQHRCGTEGITGMYAHRIHVLDEADRDHLTFLITYHFQFQLFPAGYTLFYQYLSYRRCLQTTCTHGLQLFFVIYQTAAGTTHGICRTQYHRITQLICDLQCLIHTVGNLTACHADAEAFHGLLKFHAVLTTLNGIYLYTDHLHIVLVQNAFFVQFCAKVQAGLSAQVRKQRIRSFFCDDLLQPVRIQRLDISHIRHLRICHNSRRVGVYQHDLITQAAQCLARLCTGIVKFASLSDDDRSGTDDQYFVDVCSLSHFSPLSLTA